MELILLEKIQNLGNLGDKVKVKPGYGRNYLLPQGKAVPATQENMEQFEARKAELLKAEAEKLNTAEARKAHLETATVEMIANVSPEGRLYGSISAREIADHMTEKGFSVEKSELIMSEGAIRTPGEYDITIQLHADVAIEVKVTVIGEET
jgi:large subunit ribosomal protein L9